MKTHKLLKIIQLLIMISLSSLLILSCKKKEEPPNMIPDPILDYNYSGDLKVFYTNLLPPWSVSTSMAVELDKELGVVMIEQGSLSYSGDTIIQDNSKLERSGQWAMHPRGDLMMNGDKIMIKVDGQVFVQNDVQRIYAKDDNGDWVLVSELTFNENPNADLVFSLNDAQVNGSTIGVTVPTGSIIWTLTLHPKIVP